MKILCKKCNENLSVKIDSMFEAFTPGKVECPKCLKKEERYISEADILLYFGVSEVIYVIISVITNTMLNVTGFTIPMIIVLVLIVVIYFYIQKQMTRYIYVNAPFKKEWKNHEFDENSTQVSKSMKWQFMLFFAIAITYMMENVAKTVFAILMIMSVVLTFVKFILAIKKEKGIYIDSTKKIDKKNK